MKQDGIFFRDQWAYLRVIFEKGIAPINYIGSSSIHSQTGWRAFSNIPNPLSNEFPWPPPMWSPNLRNPEQLKDHQGFTINKDEFKGHGVVTFVLGLESELQPKQTLMAGGLFLRMNGNEGGTGTEGKSFR
ncbi:hypothetical protein J6590_030940, partial [Homalodisca vitripennis]